jgi:hypothetical protein
MSTWDDQYPEDDDEDALAPSEEELKAEKERAEAETTGTPTQRGRSTADDILDAVAGRPHGARRNPTTCPLCGSSSKRRAPGVGGGVVMRKCTNAKCRNEWPQGMLGERAEIPPVPPDPAMGSFGPYHGEGGPPIDPHQPIQRRLSEFIRRARDHEP